MASGGIQQHEADLNAIDRDFAASAERARERRSQPLERKPIRGFAVPVALAAAVAVVAAGVSGGGAPFDRGRAVLRSEVEVPREFVDRQARSTGSRSWPARGALAAAETIARERGGLVSFAAIGPGRREIGFDEDRRYVSASTVKSLLLVAELRRLDAANLPLDAGTMGLLEAMITISDNEAADAIYYRVGDAGLYEVAKLAGMRRFDVDGYWANAQTTAADMAGFANRLDRLLDLPGGDFGDHLLASVIPEQSWGIPAAASPDARVRFKGGWRATDLGHLVHQIGRVDSGRHSYSLAILTDGQPSMEHGTETIRLIARDLLRTDPAARRAYPGGRGS